MGKEGDSSEGTEVLLRLGTIQLGGAPDGWRGL